MKKILQIMPLPANLAAVIRYVDEEHNVGYECLNSSLDQRCCILALVYDSELNAQIVEPMVWNNDCGSFMLNCLAVNEEIQIVSDDWLTYNDYSEIFFSEI